MHVPAGVLHLAAIAGAREDELLDFVQLVGIFAELHRLAGLVAGAREPAAFEPVPQALAVTGLGPVGARCYDAPDGKHGLSGILGGIPAGRLDLGVDLACKGTDVARIIVIGG